MIQWGTHVASGKRSSCCNREVFRSSLLLQTLPSRTLQVLHRIFFFGQSWSVATFFLSFRGLNEFCSLNCGTLWNLTDENSLFKLSNKLLRNSNVISFSSFSSSTEGKFHRGTFDFIVDTLNFPAAANTMHRITSADSALTQPRVFVPTVSQPTS